MSRKGSARIVLPVKDTNIEAVRTFMLGCLVPILAEEFLRHRTCSPGAQIDLTSRESTFQVIGKEAVR
jgi:hypothetical protein